MKLTIAEIRDEYRNAADKPEAIKKLAASEEVSEQTIKFYVRGTNAPERPIDKTIQVITDAFIPVPEKRRGRPVKNLKPTREPATKRVEKPPKIKREYKKHAKPALVKPDSVIKEAENVSDTAKSDIEKPVSAFGWPPLVIQPFSANAGSGGGEVQYTHFEPAPAKPEPKEMFFADLGDEPPCSNREDYVTGHEDDAAVEEAIAEVVASEQQYYIAPRKPPIGLMPRFIWKQERIYDIVMAIDRYTTSRTPVPLEWVEEYNEMISGG